MNFETYSNADYLMTCNNMAVGLNLPPALKSVVKDGQEIAQGLPSNAPRKAFLVDEYPACPDNWPRSEGRMKSYFVPVAVNRGLWLDFNLSLAKVNKHVAVVVSSQGVNVISGLPSHDPALEQYLDKCPKHKETFGPDRLCKKCGHKWPKQNYLTSTGTPAGSLWIDGFRADDGITRQYVFTEQEMRSVAKAILGKDRVFALGISYFLSKADRPQPPQVFGRYQLADSGGMKGLCDETQYTCFLNSCSSDTIALAASSQAPEPSASLYAGSIKKKSIVSLNNLSSSDRPFTASTTKWSAQAAPASEASLSQTLARGGLMSASAHIMAKSRITEKVAVKTMEIAAGAKIRQQIYDDPTGLDAWEAEPTALIVISYCSEQEAERIIAAGRVDLSGNPEGFLQQVPVVGNP